MIGGFGELSTDKLQVAISLSQYKFENIRIEAVFHFLDSWTGQTAYLKLPKSNTYLWTDSYDSSDFKKSESLCGSSTGEGKFSTLVSAVITKEQIAKGDSLQLEFGTTLSSEPTYASYGVSTLRVYIR